MSISAKEVQELRKMSGAGMMECKSALSDANGDVSQAFKLLREKGIAKAEKKSSRDANEGLVGIKVSKEKAAIVEVNSETDFVSRNSEFHALVNSILDISIDNIQAKYKIAVVPTIIIFKDGEEVARFQADLSFKMLATKEEVQEEIDNQLMSDF